MGRAPDHAGFTLAFGIGQRPVCDQPTSSLSATGTVVPDGPSSGRMTHDAQRARCVIRGVGDVGLGTMTTVTDSVQRAPRREQLAKWLVQLGADTLAAWRRLRLRGAPLAGRANHGHCGASAADIVCQDISANVY